MRTALNWSPIGRDESENCTQLAAWEGPSRPGCFGCCDKLVHSNQDLRVPLRRSNPQIRPAIAMRVRQKKMHGHLAADAPRGQNSRATSTDERRSQQTRKIHPVTAVVCVPRCHVRDWYPAPDHTAAPATFRLPARQPRRDNSRVGAVGVWCEESVHLGPAEVPIVRLI